LLANAVGRDVASVPDSSSYGGGRGHRDAAVFQRAIDEPRLDGNNTRPWGSPAAAGPPPSSRHAWPISDNSVTTTAKDDSEAKDSDDDDQSRHDQHWRGVQAAVQQVRSSHLPFSFFLSFFQLFIRFFFFLLLP
jgi:hypothetical protein